MKKTFSLRSKPEILETARIQTEQVNEFDSYRAEKNLIGRFNLYACSYYPVALSHFQYLQPENNLLPGTFMVDCDGEKVECWGAISKEPVRKNISRGYVDDIFKVHAQCHSLPSEEVTEQKKFIRPVWK